MKKFANKPTETAKRRHADFVMSDAYRERLKTGVDPPKEVLTEEDIKRRDARRAYEEMLEERRLAELDKPAY